jgi:NRAMP (natural resistance-associated macrophage protein)-like metal ion transporter
MVEQELVKIEHKFNRFLRILGPGLVTGAADDDPSGIATYSQTGAQFGFGQLWTTLMLFPLLIAIQEACARIGVVTGRGIAAVVRDNFSKKVLVPVVLLIIIANTINIGADIGAMAAAAHLITPIPADVWTFIFTGIVLCLEIFTSYKAYAKVLKWLALTLLAYPLTLLMLKIPWSTVLVATLIPHIEFNITFFFIITGVFGTTISPYMFFWESSQEVEEERNHHLIDKAGHPHITPKFLRQMRIDNAVGMIASQLTTWCIIVVAAITLHTNNVTTIETAADAARALEPLVHTFPNAGFLAKLIFSTGIIGLGMLALPVLAGSASYAVAEAFKWHEGLNLKFKRAHGFYGVIIAATVAGLLINHIGINPMKALIVTAVINGVVAVPLVFLVAKIASSEKIMGEYKSSKLSQVLVWLTFGVMSASAVAMLVTLF